MHIEVVPELVHGHIDRVHKFLHLGVTRLRVGEYLANEVHRRYTFYDLPSSSRSTTSVALTN
jgi:hypothetical protein